jgi:hypothetical protein
MARMPSRFQFSIRFLLAATVAVGAGAAVTRAEPANAMALATYCLTLLFAAATIVGMYQTSGTVRVFWIGTAAILCPLAVYAIQYAVHTLPLVEYPTGRRAHAAYYSKIWPVWCAAPINGVFTVFLYWLFSPRTDAVPLIVAERDFSAITIRLPRATIVALAIFPLLLLLGAAFFGAMLFGEQRERDRREQEEVEFERKWKLPVEAAE